MKLPVVFTILELEIESISLYGDLINAFFTTWFTTGIGPRAQ